MAGIRLKLKDLQLDLQNPRISRSDSLREALQKIIDDQDLKLVVLAESIIEDGLNPMDRWLVLKASEKPKKYTILEGNRRFSALMILNNPAVLNDLEVRLPVKKNFQRLAQEFDIKNIEPIDCFEVQERSEGASWINQRHTGENKGRGIVRWEGVQTSRFRGSDPALQAFEFVREHGDLTDEEKDELADRFPITTLDRLLSTPDVRKAIGVEVSDSKLNTDLPLSEVIKPLRRIILDLAKSKINVTKLKSKDQQVNYINTLGNDLPDLTKRASSSMPVENLEEKEVPAELPAQPKAQPPKKPREIKRTTLIPRDCYLTVSNPKIAEIAKELRKLNLEEYPHSISVLFRVFLELSVDHYLTLLGIPLSEKDKGGHQREKNLRTKVEEVVTHLIAAGTPKNTVEPVKKGIDNNRSPLYINTLHDYVHSSFHTPTKRELEVAWNNAQAFFKAIWK
jgi:hypothetical protein